MKILYALQATGNGHIARANVLIPKLKEHAQVDVFVSGQNSQLLLNEKATQNKGISLFYSKKGGLNYKKIIQKNSLFHFIKSIKSCPVQDYDLIVNDFEPITAYAAKLRHQNIIGLSHQAAVLHNLAPKPNTKHHFSKMILQQYAPIQKSFGFHFTKYDDSIYYPILRESIRNLKTGTEEYFLVYLPSFNNEKIYQTLSQIKGIDWIIFSPFSKTSKKQSNCTFFPIDEKLFTSYLATAKGVLCGAGFEFPAEVLHLQKMLYVIPIKGQFEQYCNYMALKQLGVMGNEQLDAQDLKQWIATNHITNISFEDETDALINRIVNLT
ncbi:glycosyl transferase [Flavobacterium sp. xlx-214]|uniref:glycosyltransferase family protein n=1 Tax=unclassified Flavobacterium TaxID=196869 RepID=UPI0013D06327|nr:MULTISPECIES: glycosyltransferase family protein [unclassified Flavobacterium]MBA5793637.1 glycosyl transferase [Flavobacterium sp. xlx-221]QMI84565.1 glycosyl transferase [Flavobacterium sp. xlx-214]